MDATLSIDGGSDETDEIRFKHKVLSFPASLQYEPSLPAPKDVPP